MALRTSDPTATDRTPRVIVEIGGKTYDKVKEYAYESNILQLGDPFRVTLGSPDGEYGADIGLGDPVKFYVSDPDVLGGAKVAKLRGLVTDIERSASAGGCEIRVSGADLGWHLANTCGELWWKFKRATWGNLLDAVLDESWGFQGVRGTNDLNRDTKINLGRAGINQTIQQMEHYRAIIAPIQFEPGQTIADVIVHYARIAKALVNVSADGYLQIFNPRYDQSARYTFHAHKASESRRNKNNVKSATLRESIGGIYTKTICVGTIVQPNRFQQSDTEDPNRGKFRSEYPTTAGTHTDDLPFKRLWTFTESEQLNRAMAAQRARWFYDRGQFDAWEYNITVAGHSQDGEYYEPDTVCEVDDTIWGVRGTYYVSAVRYRRTMRGGAETDLVIKKKDLLTA